MIYISHRGNIDGRQPDLENNPTYISKALMEGYDVEIDFWLIDGKMMLGHDEPQYGISRRFLINPFMWLHAKNQEAFELIVEHNLRGFWHTTEDFVLTTKGHIWTYPGNPLLKNSIAVLPETVDYSIEDLKICVAICSDNIERYKELCN